MTIVKISSFINLTSDLKDFALFPKAIASSSPSPMAITAKPKPLMSPVLRVNLFRLGRITMVEAAAVVDLEAVREGTVVAVVILVVILVTSLGIVIVPIGMIGMIVLVVVVVETVTVLAIPVVLLNILLGIACVEAVTTTTVAVDMVVEAHLATGVVGLVT